MILAICAAHTSRESVKTLVEIIGYQPTSGQRAPLFDVEENDERDDDDDGDVVQQVRPTQRDDRDKESGERDYQ